MAPNVSQNVTFTTATSDPDKETLTITVDFGDGSTGTGASATHAYTTDGTFTATVTVTDGNGGTATATATITVINASPVAGVGLDSDGDGFSDDLENFLGTDANSAASTPFNGQSAGIAVLYAAKRLKIILNFKRTGKDRIFLVGALPLADNFDFSGKEVVIDVAGVKKRFTLKANGFGTDGRIVSSSFGGRMGWWSSVWRVVSSEISNPRYWPVQTSTTPT